MSWFSKLISSAGSSLVESVGDAIDKTITSDEERLKLRNELAAIVAKSTSDTMEHASRLDHEATERHKTDMGSDSKLSKNIRPAALIFLTITTMVLVYATVFSDLTEAQLDTLKVWTPLLTTLLTASYVFYFGGRSYEKGIHMKKP